MRENGHVSGSAVHVIMAKSLRWVRSSELSTNVALPMVIGFGAGGSRRPLGLAVDRMTSVVLTLYLTPVIYIDFDRFRRW